MKEMVLYYAPDNTAHAGLLKGVLVQMGIKIKNLTPARCGKRIGFLAGLDGFADDTAQENSANDGKERHGNASYAGIETMSFMGQQALQEQEPIRELREELMVLCSFTDERLDELLVKLKKAGVPKIGLKAVVTETNAWWTVYELYSHLLEERRQIESGSNR